ncbi:hypothetical protein LXL04_034261 [Taraxacum kok-saghyz]
MLTTWAEFTQSLQTRFRPSTYENHEASLYKLLQQTTVSHYQSEFEKLSNCVDGLSNQILHNCFISGLRSDIQAEISLHNPQTLHQTYGFAKLIEDKLSFTRPRYTSSPRPFTSSLSISKQMSSSNAATTSTLPPLLSSPTKTTSPLPYTRFVTPPNQSAETFEGGDFM